MVETIVSPDKHVRITDIYSYPSSLLVRDRGSLVPFGSLPSGNRSFQLS